MIKFVFFFLVVWLMVWVILLLMWRVGWVLIFRLVVSFVVCCSNSLFLVNWLVNLGLFMCIGVLAIVRGIIILFLWWVIRVFIFNK